MIENLKLIDSKVFQKCFKMFPKCSKLIQNVSKIDFILKFHPNLLFKIKSKIDVNTDLKQN